MAASGEAALEALQSTQHAGRPYSLVLIDSRVPGMHGFALAQRIREEQSPAPAMLMMMGGAHRRTNIVLCQLLHGIRCALGLATREAPPQPVPPLPDRGAGPMNVLVAEDNLVNQKLVVRMLEKRGHSVTLASNGREALQAWEKQRFDLILMDVQVPEMGGFEVSASIREREKSTGAHIPIVALTAHAMSGDRERCLAAGMDGYIAKPIRAQELFETIERGWRGWAGGDLVAIAVQPRNRGNLAADGPSPGRRPVGRGLSAGAPRSQADEAGFGGLRAGVEVAAQNVSLSANCTRRGCRAPVTTPNDGEPRLPTGLPNWA